MSLLPSNKDDNSSPVPQDMIVPVPINTGDSVPLVPPPILQDVNSAPQEVVTDIRNSNVLTDKKAKSEKLKQFALNCKRDHIVYDDDKHCITSIGGVDMKK